MAKDPSYFMYFPGNYRWSAAFVNMIGSAPYGGSEFGELHKIGRLLKDKAPEDDDAWFDACAQVGLSHTCVRSLTPRVARMRRVLMR